MTMRGHRAERRFLCALVFLAALCSAVVASATRSLADANEVRRTQARRLAELVERPEVGAEGAIQGVDELFGRRLLRVNTELGPAVVFAGRGSGGRS